MGSYPDTKTPNVSNRGPLDGSVFGVVKCDVCGTLATLTRKCSARNRYLDCRLARVHHHVYCMSCHRVQLIMGRGRS